LKESIRVNGKDGREDEGTVDTTVQEKNITYPKIINYTEK
jgi:IS5 family transposase